MFESMRGDNWPRDFGRVIFAISAIMAMFNALLWLGRIQSAREAAAVSAAFETQSLVNAQALSAANEASVIDAKPNQVSSVKSPCSLPWLSFPCRGRDTLVLGDWNWARTQNSGDAGIAHINTQILFDYPQAMNEMHAMIERMGGLEARLEQLAAHSRKVDTVSEQELKQILAQVGRVEAKVRAKLAVEGEVPHVQSLAHTKHVDNLGSSSSSSSGVRSSVSSAATEGRYRHLCRNLYRHAPSMRTDR